MSTDYKDAIFLGHQVHFLFPFLARIVNQDKNIYFFNLKIPLEILIFICTYYSSFMRDFYELSFCIQSKNVMLLRFFLSLDNIINRHFYERSGGFMWENSHESVEIF